MIDELCLNDTLLASAQEVFNTMISGNIEFCKNEQDIEGDSFLGSITFKGSLEGCLTICCGVSCAKTIALKMLAMEPCEELSEEEIGDALGEVTNMVMGSVKSRLQNSTSNIAVSIPTVVTGQKLQNSLGEGTTKTCVKVKLENEYIAELSMLYKEASE
ncbi:MAG: chemotaxis protein CheX [Planctomycetes bacterium]|nr:chemotaxis protein CheX [Planctomycetota bacterium]